MNGPTFERVENDRGEVGIRCRRCGYTSYHPEDLRHRFCAFCKRFHTGARPSRLPPEESNHAPKT